MAKQNRTDLYRSPLPCGAPGSLFLGGGSPSSSSSSSSPSSTTSPGLGRCCATSAPHPAIIVVVTAIAARTTTSVRFGAISVQVRAGGPLRIVGGPIMVRVGVAGSRLFAVFAVVFVVRVGVGGAMRHLSFRLSDQGGQLSVAGVSAAKKVTSYTSWLTTKY